MNKLLNTKISLIIIFLLVVNHVFSQELLLDNLKVNSKTKIIGRCPHFDKNKVYGKFNFILEDSATIAKFVKDIKVWNEAPAIMDGRNEFLLTVLNDHEEIDRYSIYPSLGSVLTLGKFKEFDFYQLTLLHKKYPFDYSFKTKIFKTRDEYESFLKVQLKKSNFLFYYAPDFRYEGTFDLVFLTSTQFPHPMAAMKYLRPLVQEIAGNEIFDMWIMYDKVKNRSTTKEFSITVSGSKKIYEKLNLNTCLKLSWESAILEGTFFYRKKVD